MPTINKSFLYGICFASVTFTISLYLVHKLQQIDSRKQIYTLPNKEKVVSNNVLYDHDNKSPEIENVMDQEIPNLGMLRNDEDQKIRNEGYKVHAFNTLVSNQLSLHRGIPDTRHKLCKQIKYPDKLPTASVIICFYNEHLRTLLRSVHSVLQRTPESLLHEVILIDDYSNIAGLHDDVAKYIDENLSKKVKLYKTNKREGLIRARVFGSRKATGDVLVFLDSHIEVNTDWAQPLLQRINESRTHVVMPIIDIINADTFAYNASPLVRGGFNWGLHFKWDNLPKGTLEKDEDFVKPIKSPTMAGGLFAIDQKYFVEMGEYDQGMDIWGGENLEISFRVWMCGGNLELMPCSRIGHVFRHRRPYRDPSGHDTMLRNSLRVAEVWMDEYKDHFLNERRTQLMNIDAGDLTERRQLRSNLSCHSFAWYLEHVYPELVLPTDNSERLKAKWSVVEQPKYQPWDKRMRNYVGQYQLRLSGTQLCIQGNKDKRGKDSVLLVQPCSKLRKNQVWYETDRKELVLEELLCLQANQPSPHLNKCREMGGDQEWQHKGVNATPIYNMAAGTCLGVDRKKAATIVMMKLCSDVYYTKWDLLR